MITLPSDDLLLKYTTQVLDPALHLLVTRHLDLHPATRSRLAAFEQFAGAVLAAEREAPLAPVSLERTLERLNDPAAMTTAAHRLPPTDSLAWRWAGPGRAIANLDVPGSSLKVYGLKIAPGKAMLQHSHAAQEWTLIVQGAYSDENGEYGAGSFIEEDGDTNHRPVATGEDECICFAVMSGPLLAPGLMGKAAQWLMR